MNDEIYWGYTPTYERPLADKEIISRLRDIQKQIPGGSYAIDRAIEIIEAVASARTEIIRCKDCKHYEFVDNRAFGYPSKQCGWTGFEDVDDDDYCSRAERKENR